MRGSGIPLEPINFTFGSPDVLDSAYVTLDAVISGHVHEIHIVNTSNDAMFLAMGSAGNEDDLLIIPPGGLDRQDIELPKSQRLAIKRVLTGTTSSGNLFVNLWG